MYYRHQLYVEVDELTLHIEPCRYVVRQKHSGQFLLVGSEGQGDEWIILSIPDSDVIFPRGDFPRCVVGAAHYASRYSITVLLSQYLSPAVYTPSASTIYHRVT